MPTICELCGDELHINDWPFCGGVKGKHTPVNHLEMGDAPLEPYIDHNVTTDPRGVLITSRGQRRALMREHGLDYRKKRDDLVTGRRIHFDMSK